MRIDQFFSSLSEQATEITLTPYAANLEIGSSIDYVKVGEEFKIKLTKLK